MTRLTSTDPQPWTAVEDRILAECWSDPNIMYDEIARLLPKARTEGAIKHRGHKIGLGPKAKHKKPVTAPQKFTPWPDDVRFEDHPSIKQGSGANARRAAGRYG